MNPPLIPFPHRCRSGVRNLPFADLAAAMFLAASAPAMAGNADGYGVATSATAGDPYPFIRGTSAYRSIGDSSGNYTIAQDVAPVRINPCGALPPDSGFFCAASLGGTDNASYALTASQSSITFTTSLTASDQSPLSSSASSRADLSAGQLGVEVSTGYRHSNAAFAQLNDTLTFDIAGANAQTVTNISVSFELDGSLGGAGGSGSIREVLYFGNAVADAGYTFQAPPYDSFASFSQSGWVSYEWGAQTSGLTRFTGVYALTGAAPVIGLTSRLLGDAQSGTRALYGHTSSLSLGLANGVGYNSASGVFLAAVPEPGSSALLLAGLAALGWTARHRSQRPT